MRKKWTITRTRHGRRMIHIENRKFTNDNYKDVTIKEQNTRFANFEEDMRAAGRNLSTSKLNAQKKKIWDVRAGVRKIKAIVDELWASAKKTKTIGNSYVHLILKKFGKYPEEVEEKRGKPNGFSGTNINTPPLKSTVPLRCSRINKNQCPPCRLKMQ